LTHYVLLLLHSKLPFAPWVLIATWGTLFIVNHGVARWSRAINATQSLIAFANQDALSRGFQSHWVLAQLLFAAVIFSLTLFLDDAVFVFIGGGLAVSLICTLGMNVQSMLSGRALALPGAGQGALKLSTSYGYRQLAYRMICSAITCAFVGILLPHLSLLGGHYFWVRQALAI